MKKPILFFALLLVSASTVAQNYPEPQDVKQANCKAQALAAAEALKMHAEGIIASSEASQKQTKAKLKRADRLLEQGKFCQARQELMFGA